MRSTVLVMTMLLAAGAQAGDPAAGKSKAATCAACHGPQGVSFNPEWPHLAGQQEVYLRKQIAAFRDGVRVNALMQPIVKSLSDAEIDDLAAYFAGLPARP